MKKLTDQELEQALDLGISLARQDLRHARIRPTGKVAPAESDLIATIEDYCEKLPQFDAYGTYEERKRVYELVRKASPSSIVPFLELVVSFYQQIDAKAQEEETTSHARDILETFQVLALKVDKLNRSIDTFNKENTGRALFKSKVRLVFDDSVDSVMLDAFGAKRPAGNNVKIRTDFARSLISFFREHKMQRRISLPMDINVHLSKGDHSIDPGGLKLTIAHMLKHFFGQDYKMSPEAIAQAIKTAKR